MRPRIAFPAFVAMLLGVLAIAAPAASAAPPTLTVNPVTAHAITTAQLSGTVTFDTEVNGGSEGYWYFQYCEEATPGVKCTAAGIWNYGPEAFAHTLPAGTTAAPVAETLTGLKAATGYTIRLVAFPFALGAEVPSEEASYQTFTTDPAPNAPILQLPAPTPTATSVQLQGSINPEGGNLNGPGEPVPIHWAIEISQDAVNWSEVASGELSGAEAEANSPISVPASAAEAGLEPNTTFHYRLQAIYAGLVVETDPSRTFTTGALPPETETLTNTPATGGKLTFHGFLSPRNSALTSCAFQYGPTTSYGHEVPCEGTLPTPSQEGRFFETKLVNATAAGLPPETEFHYRLVAGNAGGPERGEDMTAVTLALPKVENCPNQARREEENPEGVSATMLPECRAWEMVSPPEKGGSDVMQYPSRTRAAVSGDAIEFASLGAFADTRGTSISTEYIASRDATPGTPGWATHSIYPQQDPLCYSACAVHGKETNYMAEFSPDLQRGVLKTLTPLTAEPDTADVENLYLRDDLLTPGNGSYSLLDPCPACTEPISDPLGVFRAFLADATPDLGQLIFEANQALTPEAAPEPADCLPEGGGNCAPQLYESDHGTLRAVGLVPPAGQTTCGEGGPACEAAPASEAGKGALERFYTPNTISDDGSKVFFTVPGGSGPREGNLYMRLDHSQTVQLNVSEREPCLAEPTAAGCEPQPAEYEAAATDGSRVLFSTQQQLTEQPCAGGLYAYDTTRPASDPHNLTCLSTDRQPDDGTSGAAVLGTSADGSYVYFTEQNAILPGQPPLPIATASGIYVWHDDTISLIGSVGTVRGASTWPGQRGRVSSDGRTLLFASYDGPGLTGYDQGTNCSSSGCSELYRYSAAGDQLTCVSCNPDGSLPDSDAETGATVGIGASQGSSHLNHPMTDDGEHVFFDTAERLVPEDTNGVRDVYSYDALDGTLHLLSSGTGSSPSRFLEATPDGSDVFFTTNQSLLGWDFDTNRDLYDARRGGGLPEPPPVPAACQSGETCRTTSAAPGTTSPPSQSFSGPGDPRPNRSCPKGKVKKQGRCVKKQSKKSNKGKHKKNKRKKSKNGRATSHNRGGQK